MQSSMILAAFRRATRARPATQLGIRWLAGEAGDQSVLPLRTGRPRLVILGTGWGGARLTRDIDPRKFDITVRALCRRGEGVVLFWG